VWIALVPNQNGLINDLRPSCSGLRFSHKLPYSKNWTFDMQWQAAEDTVFTIGYAGTTAVISRSRSLQPAPRSHAAHPINGQIYSFWIYTVLTTTIRPIPTAPMVRPTRLCHASDWAVEHLTGGNTDCVHLPRLQSKLCLLTANGISTYKPWHNRRQKRLQARTRSHRVLHLVAYPSTIKRAGPVLQR